MARAIVTAALLAMFTPVAANAANLISNGSFEDPVQAANGGFTNFAVGSTGITGWTVVGTGSVTVSNQNYAGNPPFVFPAQEGVQWLDLTGFNSNSVTGVAQTVSTAVGSTYLVSFFLGNVSGGIFGTQSVINAFISAGGGTNFNCTNAAPGSTLTYANCSQSFVATATSTTLTLLNGDPGNDNSNIIDNVTLELVAPPIGAVPEPATWAMMLSGFGLVGGALRYRRRKSAVSFA